MQPQPLTRVVVGLAGLYVFIAALGAFPRISASRQLLAIAGTGVILTIVVLYGLLLLLAVLMITRPDLIARIIWPGGGAEAATVGAGLAVVLFGACGGAMLATGLADLLDLVIADETSKEWLAGPIAELALGAWLFFAPSGVVELWRRGQAKLEDAPADASRLGPVLVAVLGALLAFRALGTVLPVVLARLQQLEGWSLSQESGSIVQLVVGCWFFFRASDVERFILRRAS